LHVTCYLFILHVTCYLLMLKGFLGKVEKNYNFFYTRIFHKMNKYYFLHQEKYKRWKCKNKMCRSFLWLLWATYISTFQNQKFVIENLLNVQYSTVQYSTVQYSTAHTHMHNWQIKHAIFFFKLYWVHYIVYIINPLSRTAPPDDFTHQVEGAGT
jgi:hypothetical protein